MVRGRPGLGRRSPSPIPCLRPRHELPVVTAIAQAGRQLRPRGPSSRRGRPCPTPPPHFGPPGVWRVLSRPFVLSWATETRGLGSNASHGEVPGPAVPSVTQKSSGSAAVCLNEAPLLSLPPAPVAVILIVTMRVHAPPLPPALRAPPTAGDAFALGPPHSSSMVSLHPADS